MKTLRRRLDRVPQARQRIDLYAAGLAGYHSGLLLSIPKPLMPKSLLLILVLLSLAAAPGCCVLELHPIPWMAATKPSRPALIDDQVDHPPFVNVSQPPIATPAG